MSPPPKGVRLPVAPPRAECPPPPELCPPLAVGSPPHALPPLTLCPPPVIPPQGCGSHDVGAVLPALHLLPAVPLHRLLGQHRPASGLRTPCPPPPSFPFPFPLSLLLFSFPLPIISPSCTLFPLYPFLFPSPPLPSPFSPFPPLLLPSPSPFVSLLPRFPFWAFRGDFGVPLLSVAVSLTKPCAVSSPPPTKPCTKSSMTLNACWRGRAATRR